MAGRPGIKVGFDNFSGSTQKAEILPVRHPPVLATELAERGPPLGEVEEGRGGGSRMNASPRGKNSPETGGREVKSTESTSKWSRKGLASGVRLPTLAGLALIGTPSESVRRAAPRPLQRAPLGPSSPPPANHHPQPETTSRASGLHYLVPSPPRGRGKDPGGARAAARGRGGPRAGARARRHLPSLGLPDGGV